MDHDTAALLVELTGKLCYRLDELGRLRDISENLTAMHARLGQLLEATQAQTEVLASIHRAMAHLDW